MFEYGYIGTQTSKGTISKRNNSSKGTNCEGGVVWKCVEQKRINEKLGRALKPKF